MKPNFFSLMALVSLMMISVESKANDKIIPVEKLPAAAKAFIKTHFPGVHITYAEKDGYHAPTYEAWLVDGTEIDFDKHGNWDKVDCRMSAVPDAIVPAPIADYVLSNFPDCDIVKIDKERYGYEIELSNDLELKFNKQGHLLYIDD